MIAQNEINVQRELVNKTNNRTVSYKHRTGRISVQIKQEMPSWHQKSAKKGSERYLMFGPNHILVTWRWDDGRSPGHENVCRWFLNRCK